ncbi:hypothetical protein HHK36_005460 [Tetracentron sinense]|uniref:Uncharacterized protein n=1 Tax=Tetracentron sinense TaxID=13715 RepID=A0A834ZL26_TETSI|nr:hypothetical protein HHK36_005460 [Tetracentron sinense]
MADSEKLETAINDVEEVGEESLMEGMAVLDFDMLCATVALQMQGKQGVLEQADEDGGEFGGLQRMWEGEVLDCFEDRRIALETAWSSQFNIIGEDDVCCPCYRFGKNMRRAGFGSCFIQGTFYFILAVTALLNYIAFTVTKRHCFLYLAVAFTISAGTYLGFFRTRIRKKFNIRESRTLEINNIQDGIWHGRGDTICIGSYGEGGKTFFELHQHTLLPTKSPDLCSMQRATNGSDHTWTVGASHSDPLVPPSQ